MSGQRDIRLVLSDVDGTLVTSRKPDDLPAFCKTMLDKIGEA